jgi:ferredoxin
VSVAATVASDGTTAAPKALSVLAPPQLGLRTAALRRLAAGSGVAQAAVVVPLPYVGVTSECTACGLCAKLCPTGAMTMWQDDGQYSLQYAARLCIGQACSVCAHICPVRAVTVTQRVGLAQLLAEDPVGLRAGNLVPCSHCGVPVAKTEDAPVCHACRWTRSFGHGGLESGAPSGGVFGSPDGQAGQG